MSRRLRQFADSVAAEDMHLYQPATAYRVHTIPKSGDAPARLAFAGKNPPNGAVIYFYLKQAPKPELKQEVKIEILDAAGSVIRKYSSNKAEPLDEPLDPDDKKPEKQIKLGRWFESFRVGSALRGGEPRPRLFSVGIQ